MTDSQVTIPVDGADLAATLSVPERDRAPAVLLLGGTFSDLRDGDPDPRYWPDIPPHGMYRVLAEALVESGFAVLRFDRRGCGSSSGERSDRATEVADALAAWRWLDEEVSVAGAWAMVGESAGAYVLCRLVAHGAQPAAVVLQGALHRPIAALIEFNAARARAFRDRGEDEREWMWTHARREYESAATGAALVTAILEGRPRIRVEDARGVFERSTDGLQYDVDFPPAEQFRFLRCPCLVLHGGDDLNVPVEDAFDTVRTLWGAGNRDVDLSLLARADHSMQSTPPDAEERLRERMNFSSFRRPFHEAYPGIIAEYLARQRAIGQGGMLSRASGRRHHTKQPDEEFPRDGT